MKFPIRDGIWLEDIAYGGYSKIEGGVRLSARAKDGTTFTVDDMDGGGKIVDLPDTHAIAEGDGADGKRFARVYRKT